MLSFTGYMLVLAALQIDAHIDGHLDEPQWQTAETLTGFVQIRPGDNAPPSRETTVLLTWDANTLHIGIRAADDPAKVRATVARRDDVLADDYVTLYLDTFDDHRRAYVEGHAHRGRLHDRSLAAAGVDPPSFRRGSQMGSARGAAHPASR